MRILITGGAGCLGSNLIEHWQGAGHDLLVLDNFATGKSAALPPAPRLRVAEGSIADAPLVDRCFDEFRPTHVVHSAAAYKDPSNWVEDCATNVAGAINVFCDPSRCKPAGCSSISSSPGSATAASVPSKGR